VSWNNAYDVNGKAGTSLPEAVTVDIDETPPTVAFEPVNPADPQELVAPTSDGQSGVAGGQIEIRPAAGGGWQSLTTQFDGTRLLARLDDAALAPGIWTIQATSCDRAGNCASTDETLTLPLRIGSVLSAGFEKVKDPPKRASACSRSTASRHRHRAPRPSYCRTTHVVLGRRDVVRFGKSARIRGVLTTVNGTPIPHASISIRAAPDNGLSQYNEVASATTNSLGVWAVMLSPGPSRLLAAVYAGSPTIQPSESWASVIVPASVRVLRVWPRKIPWGGKVHIRAQLLGGHLPPDGALVRLRLGYGTAKVTYGVREHVGGNGVFEVTNAFGPGPAGLVLHYWLQECTLPEGDYPFAPACGPRDPVVVGS
jgi:hypothetical protein